MTDVIEADVANMTNMTNTINIGVGHYGSAEIRGNHGPLGSLPTSSDERYELRSTLPILLALPIVVLWTPHRFSSLPPSLLQLVEPADLQTL